MYSFMHASMLDYCNSTTCRSIYSRSQWLKLNLLKLLQIHANYFDSSRSQTICSRSFLTKDVWDPCVRNDSVLGLYQSSRTSTDDVTDYLTHLTCDSYQQCLSAVNAAWRGNVVVAYVCVFVCL